MGLTDDESGVESGRNSPVNTFGRNDGRPKIRKGLGGSFFGFTPMENNNNSSNNKTELQDSTNSKTNTSISGNNDLTSSSGPPSPSDENQNLDSHANTLSESLASLASNKSNNDASINSSSGTAGSWIGIDQEEASREMAAASDLEPPHKPSLYRAAS